MPSPVDSGDHLTIEAVLRELSGVSSASAAAAVLASSIRGIWGQGAPLSLRDLKRIAQSRGIVDFEFGAVLFSEGVLVPLADGGFSVRILRSANTARARYTLAHEIGHTYFYDIESRPPRRLLEHVFDSHCGRKISSEEQFCDEFAAELLVPSTATRELKSIQAHTDASSFLREVELFGRRWGVSGLTVMRRLSMKMMWPENLLGVVCRWTVHPRTGQTPSLRVAAAFPGRGVRWFVPRNQRVRSLGLDGAAMLYDWWKEIGRSEPAFGVFSLVAPQSVRRVEKNKPVPLDPCFERVKLWERSHTAARWCRVELAAPVMYRMYASGENEAYVLAIVNVGDDVVAHLPRRREAPSGRSRDRRTTDG